VLSSVLVLAVESPFLATQTVPRSSCAIRSLRRYTLLSMGFPFLARRS
jgi:hypothetical protein